MRRTPGFILLAAAAAWAAPGLSLAADVVVPPFVGKGVDPLVVLNLTSLVASELDFMGAYDNVTQLDQIPSGLNSACFTNTTCLRTVTKAQGANALVGGTVVATGSNYDFNLVLYDADGNRVVRTKSFSLPNKPSTIADAMGGFVKELITGKSASPAKESSLDSIASATAAAAEDDDGFSFDDGDSSSRRIPTPTGRSRELEDADLEEPEDIEAREAAEALARKKAADEEAARRKAVEDEARRKAEEEARRKAAEDEARRKAAEEEARRRAEEEARRRAAEEEARRRAEEEARRKAEEEAARKRAAAETAAAAATVSRRSTPPEPENDDIEFGRLDPDAIQVEEIEFGSAADLMEVEENDAVADIAPPSRSSSSSSSSSSRTSTSREPTSREPSTRESSTRSSSRDEDLDEPSSRSRSSSSSSARSSSRDDYDDLDEPSSRSRSSASSSRSSRDEDLDEPSSRSRSSASSSRSSRDEDLDEPSSRSRSSSSSRDDDRGRSSSRYEDDRDRERVRDDKDEPADSIAAIALRVGYTGFQGLGFLAYGGELAITPSSSFAIVLGADACSVKRTVPEALLEEGDPLTQWNTILPMHAGAQLHVGHSNIRPYFGADLVFIPGYVKKAEDGTGGGTAFGGRGRAGLNLLVSDNFGFTVDAAVGLWSGANFTSVARDMKAAGFVPQIGAGTVVRF